MEAKNQTLGIALLALIAGLIIGYLFGSSAVPQRGFWGGEDMYEEMEEHMYGDDVLGSDGELQHMMDEMMLIGRGRSGEAYEEAFLRGMIVHHLGAISMSEQLLEETERPELVQFANAIIATQSTEVEQMKGWLEAWFTEE